MIQTTHLKSYFLLSVGRKILTSRLKAHRAIQFHWIDLFVFERPLLSLNSDFTWFIQSTVVHLELALQVMPLTPRR